MLRFLFSIVLLAIAPLAIADSVVVVLDGSAAMGDAADTQSIRPAVRETVVAAITTAGAADPELVIGLRLAGGGGSDEKPCRSTTSIIEPGPPDPETWASGLAGIQCHGPRPLYLSVARAIDDLEGHAEAYRVVIVTAGLDDCDADPNIVSAAVAEAGGKIDVRVIGLDLEQEMIDAFGSIAVANTTDSNSLLKALRAAILGVDIASEDEQAPEPTPTPIPAALKAPEQATTGQPLEVMIDAEGRRFVSSAECV